MLHDNNTPLAALGFEQWHPNGANMAVIVARARIRIEPDGAQFFEPETEPVLADEFVGDPHKTAMLRCNDLIPFKPFADITIQADLHAAQPAQFITGAARIGETMQTIRGCGARHWFYDKKWQLSEPEPITNIPVSYDLASGGRIIGDPDGDVDPRNPIGAGVIHQDYTPKTIELRAPQIDSETASITADPLNVPDPQGFGPIPPWWKARQQFVGTYDDAWLEKVHPRLPQDFDYRHYQVAHPNLVAPHYLSPGMTLQTVGLRPGGGIFDIQLPDVMPYATFSFTDGRQVQTRLHLDGLHLDLRSETPVYDLTWRSWIETCPALHRVDLDMGRSETVMGMSLPVSGVDGLVAA